MIVKSVENRIREQLGLIIVFHLCMFYSERWTPVPDQHICTSKVMQLDRKIHGETLSVDAITDGCRGTLSEVVYLEHVQAKISLQYYRRGDLEIYLVSPNRTRSTILQKRQNDRQVYTCRHFLSATRRRYIPAHWRRPSVVFG